MVVGVVELSCRALQTLRQGEGRGLLPLAAHLLTITVAIRKVSCYLSYAEHEKELGSFCGWFVTRTHMCVRVNALFLAANH